MLRREANSITIMAPGGNAHTFLYSEVDVKYGSPAALDNSGAIGDNGGATANPGAASVASFVATGGEIRFPSGTVFPIRNIGILDSCCIALNSIAIAQMEDDIRAPGGKVLVPAGANVTIMLIDEKKVDGRISMKFELGTADFGGRHYRVNSAGGELEPGATAVFAGAKLGTAEVRDRGPNIHIDDHSHLEFKAETPTVFKVSQ